MAKPLIFVFTLIALVFSTISGASGAAATIIMLQASSANSTKAIQDKQDNTQKESNKVTCYPQKNPSEYLWTCQDIYGNQFENLRIVSDWKNNGNNKRAGK